LLQQPEEDDVDTEEDVDLPAVFRLHVNLARQFCVGQLDNKKKQNKNETRLLAKFQMDVYTIIKYR